MKRLNRLYNPLRWLVLFVMLLAGASSALAHTPHDEANDLVISPDFPTDGTAYIIMPHWVRTPTDLYRTTDGGATWHGISIGLHPVGELTALAISPRFTLDGLLYTSSADAIFRSADRGDTWQAVSGPADIVQLLLLENASGETILYTMTHDGEVQRTLDGSDSWEDVTPTPTTVATKLAPFDVTGGGQRLLVGDEDANIFILLADEQNWDQKTLPVGAQHAVTALAATADAGTIYAGTAHGGVAQSSDGGANFALVTQGLPPDEAIQSIALSPEFASDSTLFLVTEDHAVYRSIDAGANWDLFDSVITISNQAANRGLPNFDRLLVSPDFANDDTVLLGAYDGVFLSRDRGENWIPLEANRIDMPIRLGLDPNYAANPNVFLVTYSSGYLHSDNGGDDWAFDNSAVSRLRLYDVAVSPDFANDREMFFSGNYFVAHSTDAGASWTVRDIAGELPKRLTISPNFPSDRALYARTNQRIFRTTNNGANWTQIWVGNNVMVPEALAISPAVATDQTLFIHTRASGIYKSTNGGAAWQAANTGLPFSDVDASKVTAEMAISPAYATDQTLFAAEAGGLFRSTDGAASWQPVAPDVWGGRYILALALSPNYPTDPTIIVSLRGAGLLISHDDGETFTPTGADLTAANVVPREIYFSPTYASDNTLFAVEDEVYRSQDGGATWAPLLKAARYEDLMRDIMLYPQGNWTSIRQVGPATRSVLRSETPDDSIQLFFTGNCVRWFGTLSPDQGVAAVYVDGQLRGEVDQYAANRRYGIIHATYTDLADGIHNIKLVVGDTPNPLASGNATEFDAFETATYATGVDWCRPAVPTAVGVLGASGRVATPTLLALTMLLASALALAYLKLAGRPRGG